MRIDLNKDRKKLPGNYTLITSEVGVCTKASRATSPFADPGPFTDLFGFRYQSTPNNACHVVGCSESQVPSQCDFSTNFCNMYNLYCSEADGCSPVKHDLVPASSSTEHFDQVCNHGSLCGGYETVADECSRDGR